MHTPGPWHWDSDPVKGDPTGRVRYRVTTIGKTITQVYYSSFEGGLTNAEDDARLIAAAPELLKELAHLVRLLETPINDGRVSVPGLATLNAAKAAISKATGTA
jgi:hypothetical protein